MHHKEKYVIAGGRVIDPDSGLDAIQNVYVENGKITKINLDEIPPKIKKIDATGLIVAPGFIDLHVHLREPGFEYIEDIESGSQAAAAGGFTTIFCMPNTKPVCDSAKVVKEILKKSKKSSLVNVIPSGSISVGLRGEELSDIDGMVKAGIGILSDDGNSTKNPEIMKQALLKSKVHGIRISTHPEDFKITAGGKINKGKTADELDVKGIDPLAEELIIKRDIKLAEETGGLLHVGHVSTAKGIDLIRKAKKRGVNVTCEVTPHHLTLIDKDVKKYAANAIMKPPLRTDKDREGLIKGLIDGTVDAIATDHAPHSLEEKSDIKSALFGIIGLETAFPICMKLVESKCITLNRLIELLTINPAKIMNLPSGRIQVSAPAEITLIDIENEFTIDSNKFKSKSRNTPFDGWKVRGLIKETLQA